MFAAIGRFLRGLFTTNAKPEVERSSQWPKYRAEHLKIEPICQWCHGRDVLEVHHVVPVHIAPSRELDRTNYITLCEEPSRECHLKQGHKGNWKDYDLKIRKKCRDKWAK